MYLPLCLSAFARFIKCQKQVTITGKYVTVNGVSLMGQVSELWIHMTYDQWRMDLHRHIFGCAQLYFHSVFGKMWPNNRLAHPFGLAPPPRLSLGIPEFPTDSRLIFVLDQHFSRVYVIFASVTHFHHLCCIYIPHTCTYYILSISIDFSSDRKV